MKALLLIFCLLTFGIAQSQDVAPMPKSGGADTQFFMGILLDQITTIGSLRACPSREDPKKYFYLPNKVRIATDETTGKPKFSFVKYVTNKRSVTEDTDIKEGESGGWVHFLMGLSVSNQEVMTAESELQRKVPGAKLIGPVIYRSGTVSLVTKSAATNNELKVLGTGPAPILDGDFLAVGFALNDKDATILWETLKGPNPDVSLNFNMVLAGLNAPIGAKMEVNWDVVKKHRLMNLDVDVPIVRAQISDMVTELRQNGTIKVTTVGNSALGQTLIAKVEDKITNLCFSENINNLTIPTAEVAKGEDDNSRREKEKTREKGERAELITEKGTAEIEAMTAKTDAKTKTDQVNTTDDTQLDTKIEEANTTIKASEEVLKEAKAELKVAEESLQTAEESKKADKQKEVDVATIKVKEAESALEAAKGEKERLEKLKESTAKDRADQAKTTAKISQKKVGELDDEIKSKRGITLADFSVQAVFHRSKVSHSGKLNIDLNSYDPVTINEPFGGNIGKINCRECLMEVNTASHLYTQRELIARLDGEAAQNDNFGKYINYVTVRMRKKHGSGDLTYDEIRIDRKNFNKEGNVFKMMYGWRNGDNDRRNWLNYDYQTTWNFFGGYTLTDEWKPTNSQVISVAPPFHRSEIKIMAEKEPLIAASVRAVFVKVYYKMGEIEYTKRATISPKSDLIEQVIEVLHTQSDLSYWYEIDWVLSDGSAVKSGRKTSTNTIIFADTLPTKQ